MKKKNSSKVIIGQCLSYSKTTAQTLKAKNYLTVVVLAERLSGSMK
jgi:hypothetical protein